VADPYYGDARDFEDCWQLVDAAARSFVERLKAESGFT
jgi:protein-tyrosine-phosphatase